jgi:hypothetical protein
VSAQGPLEAFGVVAQDLPEVHEVAVEVVDGLHRGRRLGQEHGERPGEGLDVVLVGGQERGDLGGDRGLAAEVGEGWLHVRTALSW